MKILRIIWDIGSITVNGISGYMKHVKIKKNGKMEPYRGPLYIGYPTQAKAKELSDKVKATEDKIDILCEQYETDNPEHLKAIRAEATPTGTVYPHDKLKEVGQVLSRDIADRQIKRDALFNAKKAADTAAKKARDDFSAHQLEDEKRKAYLENKAKLDALLPHEAEMKAKKEANDRYDKAGLVLLSLEQEAKAKRDLSAADAKLKESQAKEPETEKRLQKALESSKKIALLEEEKASLIAEGEKTGTALSKVKAIPTKEKEATEAAISLQKAAEKVADQEKAIADKRKEAQDLRAKHEKSTAEADLAAAEKDIESINQVVKTLKGFRGDFAAYREALASEKEAQEAYEAAKDKYLAADHRYSEIFVAYLDGQAGILADRLVEGTPCPVCGSTSHPHPAALSSKVDESADERGCLDGQRQGGPAGRTREEPARPGQGCLRGRARAFEPRFDLERGRSQSRHEEGKSSEERR